MGFGSDTEKSENDYEEQFGSDYGSDSDRKPEKNGKKTIQHHHENSESDSEEEFNEPIAEEEGQIDAVVSDNEELDNDPDQEPSFLQTEITYLISGSINQMNDPKSSACCSKTGDLKIQMVKKDGTFTQTNGRQLTKAIEIVDYDNRFPVALGINVSVPEVKETNVSYSDSGIASHLVAYANRAKDSINKTIFSSNTKRGEKFLKKFPDVRIDNLRSGLHLVDNTYLVKKNHPLAELITVRMASSKKPIKLEEANGYIHIEKKSADLLLAGLEKNMKKHMPLVDLKQIKVQVQPAFPTENNSSDRKVVAEGSWLESREIAETIQSETRAAVKDAKLNTPHQLYVTLRITHCPAEQP